MQGTVKCDGCGKLVDRQPIHEALVLAAANPPLQAPTCDACGALIRPTTIMFGQELDSPTLAAARKACDEADLLLVVRVLHCLQVGERVILFSFLL